MLKFSKDPFRDVEEIGSKIATFVKQKAARGDQSKSINEPRNYSVSNQCHSETRCIWTRAYVTQKAR